MKFLVAALLLTVLLSSISWQTDFEKARKEAKVSGKEILLNFSGSDWCGPCIRMHKEIFESEAFINYATDHLVLLNADFPRLRKNQLTAEQQKKNDELAELFNKEGKFPMTVLLTADGKVLKSWEGFPNTTPDAFVNEIKAATNAGR